MTEKQALMLREGERESIEEGSVEFVAAVQAIVDQYQGRRGPLIEILHAVQASFGFIPRAAVPVIGAGLNLSRAEVQGVIGFYHDFRSAPPGATTIHICRAEACQAMGVRRLEAHVKARLGVDYHQTTSDGRFTLEPVYCLGNCACTPSIRVGDAIYARVTPERFDQIMAADGAGR